MRFIWSLATSLATLAAMATIIGVFNHWPTHETAGCFIAALLCGGLSVALYRRTVSR